MEVLKQRKNEFRESNSCDFDRKDSNQRFYHEPLCNSDLEKFKLSGTSCGNAISQQIRMTR